MGEEADQEDINSNYEKQRRRIFRETFCTQYGQAVLAEILNECGYFSNDPNIIKPELVSLANWILQSCGIVTAANLFRFTEAIVSIANDKDLEQMFERGNK